MSSWWIRANQRHSISRVTASSRLCNSAGVRVFLTARMKPSASARHDSLPRCLPNGIVPTLPPVHPPPPARLSRRTPPAPTATHHTRRRPTRTDTLPDSGRSSPPPQHPPPLPHPHHATPPP